MFASKQNRVFRRDREPSRIPEASLKRLGRKSRKLKEFVYECIRMWFLVFCITCFFKPTKRSKYVHSLLIFNESQMPLIEYNKTVNSTASLFAAISNIQKSYNGLQSH